MQTISMRQERPMEMEALKDLIPLFIAGATTLGGAVAWLLTRYDIKLAAAYQRWLNIKDTPFK